ncbi:MAG TPA: DUF167 domain-containing protein [Pyrinomonadaceae bacterium]|nr:DUF167 domain-containing protein [Pyrinomonadaceae bacterium]
MIHYVEKDGALTFKVRVVPRASRSEIIGEHDDALRVRLAAPPVDGAANEELLRLLARMFDLPLRAVQLVSGNSSKVKTVSVAGGRIETLESLLRTCLTE